MRLRDASDGGELFETYALVVGAERSFRKKIHGEQNAHQEREKREREFPK